MPLWMLSIDLRKAFDTVDHEALLHALQLHGIDEKYRVLLQVLYSNQYGCANGSRDFPILRGVKQGDVLSAILFNCVLDVAFQRWKTRLSTEGIF